MVGLWFLVPAIGVRVPDRQLLILTIFSIKLVRVKDANWSGILFV